MWHYSCAMQHATCPNDARATAATARDDYVRSHSLERTADGARGGSEDVARRPDDIDFDSETTPSPAAASDLECLPPHCHTK